GPRINSAVSRSPIAGEQPPFANIALPLPAAGALDRRFTVGQFFSIGLWLASLVRLGTAPLFGAKSSVGAANLWVGLRRRRGILLAGAAMAAGGGLQHDVLFLGGASDLLCPLFPFVHIPDSPNRLAYPPTFGFDLSLGLDSIRVSPV